MARSPKNRPSAQRNNTPAPAMPAVLEGLMRTTAPAPQPAGGGGLAGAMPFVAGGAPAAQAAGMGRPPSYQMGGMVGPAGQPQRPAGMTMPGQGQAADPQQVLTPDNLEAEAARIVRENPQAVERVRQELMLAIQQGQFTMEELRMGVQMAKAALRNPDMYPQLRQLAIERGMASPDQLSPQYDPGYLFLIILGGEAVLSGQGQQAAGVRPSMERGGPLPEESSNADGTIPINAHEGEYVIPKHVVRAKGTEFFDKLLEQYDESDDSA